MSDIIQNWYSKIPKKLVPKYHNPNFSQHRIKIPARVLVCAQSGGGKTNLMMEIIHRMSGTFELIILCVKTSQEPLYTWLKMKLDPEQLHIYENGVIPKIEDYKSFKGQILVIFDDLVNEKKAQEPITEWFIRGRKLAGGTTMFYLTQSYFKTPKTIRVNCNIIMLKKLSSIRDLNMILGDYNLGVGKQKMLDLYHKAIQNNGFLFIDIDAPEEERFRKNFKEILI